MVDREPDQKLQTDECKKLESVLRCKNMKDTNPTSIDGEQYRCEVCGAAVYLDYDEMR